MKTLSFAVPCYNSADYMDKCIESLLACGDDIEILIVDDGSVKDNTAEKADEWQSRYPDIIKAIHKENGGHGSAVNAGLARASARYFKVVDSDDWLDADAMVPVMKYLRLQMELKDPTDLVIANYVYEKVFDGTRTVMRYKNVFPEGREFGWDEVGIFSPSQYLLMHSVIYRFVYEPLPHVRTMRYFDVDMYRYFIGREDQSVNETVMMGRIDQQLRVTRTMIDAVDVMAIGQRKLRHYMENYLSMMMCICSVFLRMRNTPEDERKRDEIWSYLKNADAALYRRVRTNALNFWTNVPTEMGRRVGLGGYHLAQKIFKFN